MTDPFREWDVAYVLGSLSPSDRKAYEHHLADCPACEREVGRLAGTAGLLSRVPVDWAVASLTTPRIPATVLTRPARRSRLAVAAATILVAAVIGAVVALLLCA